MLTYVPDRFKTKTMCERVVEKFPRALENVSDWLVTQQQVDTWHDYHCHCHCTYHNNEIIQWYDGYQKRKAQNALVKEELIPVTWHPSRQWDWCMSEDEKKRDRKIVEVIKDNSKII